MLQRNLSFEDLAGRIPSQELARGTPTIFGFANLCAGAIAGAADSGVKLSREAQTILACSAEKGMIDLRASKEGFDSTERLLAVCVETGDGSWLLFRQKGNARKTIEFLEGFRQLCQSGLVMHHIQADFSLTSAGFSAAQILDMNDYANEIQFATRIEY